MTTRAARPQARPRKMPFLHPFWAFFYFFMQPRAVREFEGPGSLLLERELSRAVCWAQRIQPWPVQMPASNARRP